MSRDILNKDLYKLKSSYVPKKFYQPPTSESDNLQQRKIAYRSSGAQQTTHSVFPYLDREAIEQRVDHCNAFSDYAPRDHDFLVERSPSSAPVALAKTKSRRMSPDGANNAPFPDEIYMQANRARNQVKGNNVKASVRTDLCMQTTRAKGRPTAEIYVPLNSIGLCNRCTVAERQDYAELT